MHQITPLRDEALSGDPLRSLVSAVCDALSIDARLPPSQLTPPLHDSLSVDGAARTIACRRMQPDPYAGGAVRELTFSWERDDRRSLRLSLVENAWVGWELVATAHGDDAWIEASSAAWRRWCEGRAK